MASTRYWHLSPQRSDRAWAPHVITRDVEASAIADFALVPPRTALAATVNDEIVVLPVRISLEARPTRRRQPMTAPMVPIALADRQGSRRADRLVDPVPRGGSRSLRPRSAWARPDKCSRPWLRRPVADVKAEPPHSFRSSNLEAAVRTSRVMILASRSRSGSIHAATSAPPLTGRWPERVVVAVS